MRARSESPPASTAAAIVINTMMVSQEQRARNLRSNDYRLPLKLLELRIM
jgi:hypothetical protein